MIEDNNLLQYNCLYMSLSEIQSKVLHLLKQKRNITNFKPIATPS